MRVSCPAIVVHSQLSSDLNRPAIHAREPRAHGGQCSGHRVGVTEFAAIAYAWSVHVQAVVVDGSETALWWLVLLVVSWSRTCCAKILRMRRINDINHVQ